jgi:hypothetical protein
MVQFAAGILPVPSCVRQFFQLGFPKSSFPDREMIRATNGTGDGTQAALTGE